jgi:hypothetical protein
MIPEAHACSYQLHTTQPYLTNRTYRENAEALIHGWLPHCTWHTIAGEASRPLQASAAGTITLVIASERHPTNSGPRAPALTADCSATQASAATVAGGWLSFEA